MDYGSKSSLLDSQKLGTNPLMESALGIDPSNSNPLTKNMLNGSVGVGVGALGQSTISSVGVGAVSSVAGSGQSVEYNPLTSSHSAIGMTGSNSMPTISQHSANQTGLNNQYQSASSVNQLTLTCPQETG